MTYVIAAPCTNVKDTACVDVCPVDCIHPRGDEANFSEAPQLYIDAENCICCGACVPVCPASAIFAAEDLPDEWKLFERLNNDWFAKGAESTAIAKT